MFSVVIPLYNKEQNIKNTIQSVLDQTFKDFEIVVVNDGSTDRSLRVVEAIEDPRIRIINKPNGGVSSARNRGINEARYEWVAFLDADDLWEVNHLEEYFYAIGKHPDLIWLISGYTSKKGNEQRQFVYSKEGVLDNIFDDLLKGLKIHTSTVCVRKDVFDLYPDLYFAETVSNSEDREVWYKLCCLSESPFYINKGLSVYDANVLNSLTNSSSSIGKEDYLTLEDRLNDFEPYVNLSKSKKDKLTHFIFQFNNRAIKEKYVGGFFKKEYKRYLTALEYKIFSKTYRFQRKVKRLIVKIC